MFMNRRTVRIEWGDCDPAGIVFYPRYMAMFDHSTVLLLEAALGQPVGFAQTQTPSSLLERLDSDIRPSRMKCVTLPLSVLQEALSGQEVTR